MAKKNAIVNMFNVNEAAVNYLVDSDNTETIKKGKYRVFNGNGYDIVYLQTSADQVLETENRKFVSQADKNIWSNKADHNHDHDDVYAKISNSYTRDEITGFLNSKAEKEHTHAASNIIEDSNRRFVTEAQKSRWSDTYTISQVDSKIGTINETIRNLEIQNTSDHSAITQEYQNADLAVERKVATVQSNLDQEVKNLTALINSGGTANTELAHRVTTIETTTIPAVERKVSDLDSKFTKATGDLDKNKADKNEVSSSILAAKQELQTSINDKANTLDVNRELKLKANVEDVYNKQTINNKLDLKADLSYVNRELEQKVSTSRFQSELAKKADAEEIKDALDEKASKQDLEIELAKKAEKEHTHVHSQIKGLGDVVTKNVGTEKGNVPILNEDGKLDSSILPAIAINETFTADNQTKAMEIPMQIGDILVLTNVARDAAILKQEQGQAITYQAGKTKNYKELSDEYTAYIASGKMTYLCVDDEANDFEEKFKPLQSSGDTISSAEVESKLAGKVNVSDFNNYKTEVLSNLDLKADKEHTYSKQDVDRELAKKVNVEQGKQLSTHDFTNDFKIKLEGLNNYVHPTEDGHLHVPETGTLNNGKVLMAGSSAGALHWTALTTANVSESADKKYVTDEQIRKWTAKADAIHDHDQYRLKTESFNKNETITEINKMQTIISTTQPSANSQMVGAVWIEEIK